MISIAHRPMREYKSRTEHSETGEIGIVSKEKGIDRAPACGDWIQSVIAFVNW